MHPHIVNHRGFGSFSYVLGDETKVGANVRTAGGEFWFTRKLMGYAFVSGHLASMVKRSLREHRIKTKRLKAACDTILIGGGEEILFG